MEEQKLQNLAFFICSSIFLVSLDIMCISMAVVSNFTMLVFRRWEDKYA
jgi:hypothetical protein